MPKAKPLPPVEVLEEWFSYDVETGDLRWRKSPSHKKGWEGRISGFVDGKGYLGVMLQGAKYKVHRIAFKMAVGIEPPEEIDHRDGNRLNNRLSNLRVPELGDNPVNAKTRKDNSSGHVGVRWDRRMRLWSARITRHGVRQQASFLTQKEALAWRHQKEIELHGEFAQHRRNGVPKNLPESVTTRTTRRCNTSGTEGVSWHARDGRWRARISTDGGRFTKNFRTKEEAIAQRLAWEAEFSNNKPETSNAQ